MPRISAVSFDCAGTLLKVQWSPSQFALDCAAEFDLNLDQQVAKEIYDRLVQTGWRQYQLLNQSRDPKLCRNWWREITTNWLEQLGVQFNELEALLDRSDAMLIDETRGYFTIFDDVIETVQSLVQRNIPMAILSNWDVSLHRIVEARNLTQWFNPIIASLEEGVEKPEPALFALLSERMKLDPAEILHVGDHPRDDVMGATNAGFQSSLIDRGLSKRDGSRLSDLRQVVHLVDEALA